MKPIKEITSFTTVTLRLSGSLIPQEYEIRCTQTEAEITYSIIEYSDGEEQREVQQSARCDAEAVLQLLNDCKVGKWNGFDGDNPPGLVDGTMFSFSAVVNDGATITARGSNNYPKHYHDFYDGLQELLKEEVNG